MSRLPQSRPWPARQQRGFTLVELAVVVVIIGLLAALALPGFRRVTLKSRATATVNDIRVFAAAFSNYNMQNGWPVGGTGPGVVPPELANALPPAFSKPTPIGGQYEWIALAGGSPKAAIGITIDGNTDMELLELIDSMMDDGDTSKGNVYVSGPDFIYVIEP